MQYNHGQSESGSGNGNSGNNGNGNGNSGNNSSTVSAEAPAVEIPSVDTEQLSTTVSVVNRPELPDPAADSAAGGGQGSFGQEDLKKLDFQTDNLIFPENLTIQSYDIGVILGNALDNAIEACQRLIQRYPQAEPFIRLSSFQRGKYFFLEVANSFDGTLKQNRQSEFPATLKNEKQIHSIGFANMKKTAEKYDGAVDFSVEGNPGMPGFAIFTLSIMMKNTGQQAPQADPDSKKGGKA